MGTLIAGVYCGNLSCFSILPIRLWRSLLRKPTSNWMLLFVA